MSRKKQIALGVGLGVGIPLVIAAVVGTLAGLGFYSKNSDSDCEKALKQKLKDCPHGMNMLATNNSEIKKVCAGKVTPGVFNALNLNKDNIVAAALCSSYSKTCDFAVCKQILTLPKSVAQFVRVLKQLPNQPVNFDLASLYQPPTPKESLDIARVLYALKLPNVTPTQYKQFVLKSILLSVNKDHPLGDIPTFLTQLNIMLTGGTNPCVINLISQLRKQQQFGAPVNFDIESLLAPPSDHETNAIQAILTSQNIANVTPAQYKGAVLFAIISACPNNNQTGDKVQAFLTAFGTIIKNLQV